MSLKRVISLHSVRNEETKAAFLNHLHQGQTVRKKSDLQSTQSNTGTNTVDRGKQRHEILNPVWPF